MNLVVQKPTMPARRLIQVVGVLFVSLIANASLAMSNIDVGVKVGESAPQITTQDIKNNPVKLEGVLGEKGLIIVFFRSADWCPYCKKHLIELNQQAEKFTQLGYGLAGISYDNTQILKDFSLAQKITYPLLSDQNVATMKAFKIVNQKYGPNDDNYGIPYPGVVVIDNQGKVIHKYFYQGYKNRVKFPELYTQLATRK